MIEERTEIENGKIADRPELATALHLAKVTGATLAVAKLDRLSRSVTFLSALQDSGARFVAADMPEANELTVHIMAAVAHAEREAISNRTKDALRAAKAAGSKLGNPNGAAALRRAAKGNSAALAKLQTDADEYAHDLAPVLTDIEAAGVVGLAAIARELNARHIQTRRGGRWYPPSVRNLMDRLNKSHPEAY